MAIIYWSGYVRPVSPERDEIPVIALSASIAKEHEALSGGWFHGFLEQKPFTAAQLISLLNELLTLHLEARSELNFSSLTAFAGEDRRPQPLY